MSVAATLAILLMAPRGASAFCGFYVSGADAPLGNDTSFVVLLRDGTRTVMTMRNDYVGPPEDFALVVPLPTSISEDDVHVIDDATLERIERFTSPRLVEYWEQAPVCPSALGARSASVPRIRTGAAAVTVETSFSVGEYDFVVLGADDSLALERWLDAEGYRVPANAAPLLSPYVAAGARFLVAKVDAGRVRFVDGKADLSPLRIAYDSPRLELPLRLGLANSRGVQDVVVVVVSRDGRYEVANRPNVLVPTNLVVRPEARARFGELYASILDRTFERHPGAVVTEHAWSITGCDPCTGPTLDVPTLDLIGGDVISGTYVRPTLARTVTFPSLERLEGSGHAAGSVRALLESLSPAINRCAAGYGVSSTHVDVSFAASGELTRMTVPGPASERGACLSRALGGARLFRPPLGRATSRWRVGLRFAPGHRYTQPSAGGFTATRLHLRVKPDGDGSDLVFRRAPAIAGGVGTPAPDGSMPGATRHPAANTFQARYAILHAFEGDVACEHPVRVGYSGAARASRAPRPRQTSPAVTSSTAAIESLLVRVPPALRRRGTDRRGRHGSHDTERRGHELPRDESAVLPPWHRYRRPHRSPRR